MVSGLPELKYTEEVCEGCTFGKHHREGFESGNSSRSPYPLQLIHTDVCGSMQTTTMSGNIFSYVLLMIAQVSDAFTL